MTLFPVFRSARLADVEPGSLIVCEAGPRGQASICGPTDEEEGLISVYTVFTKGDGDIPDPHIGQWWSHDNPAVADFGREYVLMADPDSFTATSRGESDLGSALCIRGNDRFIGVLFSNPLRKSPRIAFLNLESGHSVWTIDPPYVVARSWSIGFIDPAGQFKSIIDAPKRETTND